MKTYNVIINDNFSVLVSADEVGIDNENDFAHFYRAGKVVATFSFRYIAGFYATE